MQPFQWRDGQLHADDVPVPRIAEAAGTPTYVYSATAIRAAYRAAARAPSRRSARSSTTRSKPAPTSTSAGCCASWARGWTWSPAASWSAPGSPARRCRDDRLRRRRQERRGDPRGARRPVQPGARRRRAVRARPIPPDAARSGSSTSSRRASSRASPDRAPSSGVRARVCLRVNPNVDPHTHEYTTTGKEENKFGIDADRDRRRSSTAGRGDPGSRVPRSPRPHRFAGAAGRALRRGDRGGAGAGRRVGRARPRVRRAFDLGGGWPVPYTEGAVPPIEDYAAASCRCSLDRARRRPARSCSSPAVRSSPTPASC